MKSERTKPDRSIRRAGRQDVGMPGAGFAILVLTALLMLGMAACGSGDGGAGPVEPRMEGVLNLDSGVDQGISGTFERGGTTVSFEMSEARIALSTSDGSMLYESTMANQGASRKLTVLDITYATGAFRKGSEPQADLPAFEAFLAEPEAGLLPYLSEALGQKGYNGVDYPRMLEFHLLAMVTAQELGITDVGKRVETFEATSADMPSRSAATRDYTCPDGKYPINAYNDPCFGMCGPYCTHWAWVCLEEEGKPCARGGCAWHDYIGYYGNLTGNPKAINDFWNLAPDVFRKGGGCSTNQSCYPFNDESLPCHYWDGDLQGCDAHGIFDPNPNDDTQDCAYYLTTGLCRARGTANEQAGIGVVGGPETYDCAMYDGNVHTCDQHGIFDPDPANDTQDCAFYWDSINCRERGTSNCQAGVTGPFPW